MWEEVYYKELNGDYEGRGRKILPYSVKCKDNEELNRFIHYLTVKGFMCVNQIEGRGLCLST